MPEPTGGTPTPESGTQTGGTHDGKTGGETPQITPDMQAIIDARVSEATKKANKEAETNRLKLKEFEDKQKAEADKKLADDKKFEELATQREKEVNDLKAQLAEKDAYKARLDAIEAERKQELLAKIPAEKREAFKDFSNDQLKVVVDNLPAGQQPPGTSQGSERQQGGSADKDAKDYTEDELLALKRTNPAKYNEILQKLYRG